MSLFVVNKSISIKASPAKVWNALTDPDRTKKYFFNCEVHSDWKPGSRISFTGKMFFFIPIEMTGTIEEIEPEKRLKYSLKNGKNDDTEAGTSLVTDVLTYKNGETTLSITDDVGGGEGAEKRLKRSEKGWDKVLKGLKELIEKD